MSKLLLLRPLNMLLLCVVQIVISFGLWYPSLKASNSDITLNNFEIILLIYCTIIIAGSANVINDYYDQLTDKINRPTARIVGKKISPADTLKYYWKLVIMGLIPAIYLAFSIDHPFYIGLYVGAVFILLLYSKYFKRISFVGNIVVAGFSGLFYLVFVLAEWPVNMDNNLIQKSLSIIISFAIFSFLISASREIIKDLQDMKGDQSANFRTLPLTAGILFSKLVVYTFLFSLLFGTTYWIVDQSIVIKVYGFLLICLPVCYLIYETYIAKKTIEFQVLSTCHKLVMFSGLIFLVLHIWF